MNSPLPSGAPPLLRRTTALAGLATLLLQLGGQALMQAGGREPAFDATAAEISDFFASADRGLFAAGSYLSVLSLLTALWFFGGMYALMRDDWRAPIALVCGVTYAAGVGVGWELGVFRIRDGLDPELARLAFDLGNLSFASSWVALGGFAVATGWALLATRDARGLLGWWGIAAGVGLIAARAGWTTPWWFVGYAMFWVWAVVLCVRLLSSVRTSPPVQATGLAAETSRR